MTLTRTPVLSPQSIGTHDSVGRKNLRSVFGISSHRFFFFFVLFSCLFSIPSFVLTLEAVLFRSLYPELGRVSSCGGFARRDAGAAEKDQHAFHREQNLPFEGPFERSSHHLFFDSLPQRRRRRRPVADVRGALGKALVKRRRDPFVRFPRENVCPARRFRDS